MSEKPPLILLPLLDSRSLLVVEIVPFVVKLPSHCSPSLFVRGDATTTTAGGPRSAGGWGGDDDDEADGWLNCLECGGGGGGRAVERLLVAGSDGGVGRWGCSF